MARLFMRNLTKTKRINKCYNCFFFMFKTDRYETPVKHGVNIIKGIMFLCAEECSESRFKSYPKLRNVVSDLVKSIIERNVKLTNSNLTCYLEAQKSFINIKHPDFLQEISAYSNEIKFVCYNSSIDPEHLGPQWISVNQSYFPYFHTNKSISFQFI